MDILSIHYFLFAFTPVYTVTPARSTKNAVLFSISILAYSFLCKRVLSGHISYTVLVVYAQISSSIVEQIKQTEHSEIPTFARVTMHHSGQLFTPKAEAGICLQFGI